MQNQFIDLYRNGIKTAADVARTTLENSVKLQEKQLGIVRNILEENRRSADGIAEAKSIDDLITLQSRMAGTQLERAAEFWSSMWFAAAEQQKAWIEQLQSQIGQAKERVRETYDMTTRASEDMARNAANQMSRTTGQVRDAVSNAERSQRKSA
jgi:archaeosine-15-forming tRNA-guanine transglycosylase